MHEETRNNGTVSSNGLKQIITLGCQELQNSVEYY